MKAAHEDHTEFLLYLVWIHDDVGNLFLYCKNVGRLQESLPLMLWLYDRKPIDINEG